MSDAAEVADECVRLLRERRPPVSAATAVSLANQVAAACGREANAVAEERAKVVAWLRSTGAAYSGSLAAQYASAIERGEHDR